jgi:two-component system, cell cycle sensor histidine kinase and response regulator CckA
VQPVNVLLVEDNPGDARLIQEFGRESSTTLLKFSVESRLMPALDRLATEIFDIVLLDLNLPDSNGVATLVKVREKVMGIPVVVLTGTNDESMGVQAIRNGAFDYLVKEEIDGRQMLRSLRYAIERQRVEKILIENEEQFRAIFEWAPYGMALLDLEGRLLRANRALCDMLGYTEGELLKAGSLQSIAHPDDRAEDAALHGRMLAGEIPSYLVNQRYYHQEGHVIWGSVAVSVVRDRGGIPLRAVAQILDVTVQKYAKRALREKDSRLRSVMDNVADGIITMDQDGIIESVNTSAMRIFDYTAGELIGRNVNMLISERQRGRQDASITEYLGSGESTAIGAEPRELVGLRKDGSTILIEMSISEMKARGTRIIIGTLRDITTREQTAAQLKKLSWAAEQNTTAIAIIDVDGNIEYVNPKFTEITGYAPEESIGAKLSILQPEKTDAAAFEDLWKALKDGKSWRGELANRRKDGKEFLSALTVSPLSDDDGNVVNFVATSSDVTDKRKIEAQLQQAQKIDAIGQLTGGIAHDFNNILGIVLGNLQLLQRRIDANPRMLNLIEAAIAATKKGADLTGQLLAFSRRQELEPQVLDVNALVTNMNKMFRRTLGGTIEIVTNLADNLGAVHADPSQLENALLNLAINARDAMSGNGRLIIETSNVDIDTDYVKRYPHAKTGPHVCISVTDSGAGIPADVIERIFEPFFTTKAVGKGTGLGLSMIYGFVKQSGGHINVYSEVGHGARFGVYLPQAIGKSASAVPGKTADEELPTGDETVLLVEDDEQFRKTAALLLEDLGYTVISAMDGPSALKSLESYPDVDLLFTDMVMPGGINGHQLAERVQNLRPDLPILLASGYPRDAFSQGRNFPLMSKPYTNITLARMIRTVLDEKKPEK